MPAKKDNRSIGVPKDSLLSDLLTLLSEDEETVCFLARLDQEGLVPMDEAPALPQYALGLLVTVSVNRVPNLALTLWGAHVYKRYIRACGSVNIYLKSILS